MLPLRAGRKIEGCDGRVNPRGGQSASRGIRDTWSRMPEDVPLSRIERLALRLAEATNEDPRGKWLQTRFLRGVSYVWVRGLLANRVFVEGLDDLMALHPPGGVMLV